MAGAHDHHHHHIDPQTNERRLLFVIVLTGSFMIVEAIGGWLSGSLALLADAAHMFTDTLALSLAWLGFYMGRKAADPLRTYGYRRLEVLAAWFNGMVLIALCAWIAFEASRRLLSPQPILAGPMLAVASVGLMVNLLVLWILFQGDRHNLNMRAATLHVIGDVLGSVGAIVAAVGILLTGWTQLDSLLSVLVAALILRSAWMLVRQSTHILLEGAPEGLDLDLLCSDMLGSIDGVLDVHHVHAWSLSSGTPLVTLHLRIDEQADPRAVLDAAKARLAREYGVDHSVVQIEVGDCPDE